MNDIDINNENICNLYKSMFKVEDKINSLVIAISRINKSDLKTIELLEQIKLDLEKYNNTNISILKFTIKQTIEKLSIDPAELEEQYNFSEDYCNDISYSSDGFNYVTDLDALLAKHEKGLIIASSLGFRVARLFFNKKMTTGQEYIINEIEEVWNNKNYSPREKVVNTDLKMLEIAANVGAKPGYRHAGTWGKKDEEYIKYKVPTITVTNSVDCNAWVSWGMWGDPKSDGTWMSVSEFADAGRETTYEKLQPGDIAVRDSEPDGSGGHVVRIIKNYPETGECIISEASSKQYGTRIRKVSYETLEETEGLLPRDMGCFYGEW